MHGFLDTIQRLVVLRAFAQNDTLDNQLNAPASKQYYVKLAPLAPGNQTVGDYVTKFIDLILYAAGIAAVIYLLYAGILYITSAGDEAKAAKGRQGLTYAIVGIVIITLAFVIEKVVAGIFVTP